ncbi:MAG: F0F1-type synthase, alpha subunit [Acidobacteriaceae bacterium]|nr:F0F1-type synthase, alpha subunit [Acidobacteriaceae bacterium]
MHLLPFTHFLNNILGGPVNELLSAIGHPAHDPSAPISNWFAMEVLVVSGLIIFFALVRSRLSVENPGGVQHTAEMLNEFISGQSEEIIGHHSEKFTPFLATLFVFILFANLIGLIPTLESPTANPAVPLGLALVTWFYYHIQGVKKQGLAYFKHFLGPVWWLAPLMLPIEIVSHMARAMSLTIRLYANIFAGDMVTLVFFSLIPIGVPVIFLMLHVGVSMLQAYIFVLLATVYLAGAVAEEH